VETVALATAVAYLKTLLADQIAGRVAALEGKARAACSS
jgi:hypothetical protein